LNLLPSPNFGVYLSALIGITLINAISFKDDISEVPTCIRLMIHIAGILFIASQASVFTLAWYYVIIAIICGVGFINAYNFMDGIAGMAGSYSIVVLTSIYYINANAIISPDTFSGNRILLFQFSQKRIMLLWRYWVAHNGSRNIFHARNHNYSYARY
ncbi:MAG: hypothetical protein RR667_02760, partial [Muribaculaceae bacterium]